MSLQQRTQHSPSHLVGQRYRHQRQSRGTRTVTRTSAGRSADPAALEHAAAVGLPPPQSVLGSGPACSQARYSIDFQQRERMRSSSMHPSVQRARCHYHQLNFKLHLRAPVSVTRGAARRRWGTATGPPRLSPSLCPWWRTVFSLARLSNSVEAALGTHHSLDTPQARVRVGSPAKKRMGLA